MKPYLLILIAFTLGLMMALNTQPANAQAVESVVEYTQCAQCGKLKSVIATETIVTETLAAPVLVAETSTRRAPLKTMQARLQSRMDVAKVNAQNRATHRAKRIRVQVQKTTVRPSLLYYQTPYLLYY